MVISMDQEQAVTEEKGLRRLKRTRLIAAGVTLALTLAATALTVRGVAALLARKKGAEE